MSKVEIMATQVDEGSDVDSEHADSPTPDMELSKQEKESVRGLVAGMTTVVSYRCAVDENHDLLRSLELYNKAYWDKLGTLKDSLPNDPEHIRRQRVKKREKERRKQLEAKQKKDELAAGKSQTSRLPGSAPPNEHHPGSSHETVDIAPIESADVYERPATGGGGLPRINKPDSAGKLATGRGESPGGQGGSSSSRDIEGGVADLDLQDPYPNLALSPGPQTLINGRPPLRGGSQRRKGSGDADMGSSSQGVANGVGANSSARDSDADTPVSAKSTAPTKLKRTGSFPRKVSAPKSNSALGTPNSSKGGAASASEPPVFSFANPLPPSTGNPNGNAFAKKLSDMAYLTTETKRIERKKQKQTERNSMSTSFEKMLAAARSKSTSSREVASGRWNI